MEKILPRDRLRYLTTWAKATAAGTVLLGAAATPAWVPQAIEVVRNTTRVPAQTFACEQKKAEPAESGQKLEVECTIFEGPLERNFKQVTPPKK